MGVTRNAHSVQKHFSRERVLCDGGVEYTPNRGIRRVVYTARGQSATIIIAKLSIHNWRPAVVMLCKEEPINNLLPRN